MENLTRSTSFTPDLSLSLRNGVGLNAAYNSIDQSAVGGGNTARSEQHDLTAAVNYAFLLPQSFGKDRKQVRTSLSALLSTNNSCLTLATGGPCATISDLPPGEYTVRIWHPSMEHGEETTARQVTLSADAPTSVTWEVGLKPTFRVPRASGAASPGYP